MNDIAEYERRISAALERIGRGIEALAAPAAADEGAPPPGTDAAPGTELAQARAALEAERASNADLVARVQQIRDRQQTLVAELEGRVARLGERAEAQSAEIGRLKTANAGLTAALSALREAAEADGALVDDALRAEVEALRAARRAEAQELDDLLAELRPLIGEETGDA